MDIRALDDNQEWERWIVEEICNLDFEEYLINKSILNQKRLEHNFDVIISRIERMRLQIENPPLFAERVFSEDTIYAAYQILAILILETGSYIPEIVKENVLKSTTWEFDKRWGWRQDALNIRRYYLNEFREKILNYAPGKKHKFIDLKIHTDEEFKKTCVGLRQLHECIDSGKINNINYINLDCCELRKLPEELLLFDHIEKLSLERNYLTTLPEWIINFKSIRTLYLKFNFLRSLPKSFSKLILLERFELYGNPLKKTDLPYSILPPKIARKIKKTKEFLKIK